MIETWEEFKTEKKIWTGEPNKTPNENVLLESLEEADEKKSFEELILLVKEIGATDCEIEILTNEDGEYGGCYLESVTINKVKFSAAMEGDTDALTNNEIGVWGQLSIERLEK